MWKGGAGDGEYMSDGDEEGGAEHLIYNDIDLDLNIERKGRTRRMIDLKL